MRSFLVLLILIPLSCQVKPVPITQTTIEIGDSVNLLEIEKYGYATYPLDGDRKSIEFREQLNFVPLFLGDSLELPTLNYSGMYNNLAVGRWFDNPEHIQLNILVDTTHAFRHLSQWIWDFSIGFRENRRDTTLLDWYPVYIENRTQDSVQIGYDLSLQLFIEAKDRNGNWRSINQPEAASCGVGKYQQLLPPSQYALTGVPVYSGPFLTKARLVFYANTHVYSNEFEISIHESQFELPIDSEFSDLHMRLVYYGEIF